MKTQPRCQNCTPRARAFFGLAFLAAGLALRAADSADLAPLELKLPLPAFIGTPPDVPATPHLEPPSEKPRPPFLAPKGITDVALHKKVTCSDPKPLAGKPDLVTDGDKEATDDSILELHPKSQWVQIDLEAPYRIFAILIWHAHDNPQVTRDVVVQVSDDPAFKANVTTVFNNDFQNNAGLGAGTDKQYFESYEGRLISCKGLKGRFVRLYSNGSTHGSTNIYTEVEVYGLPETAESTPK